jgi:hypothetical protein
MKHEFRMYLLGGCDLVISLGAIYLVIKLILGLKVFDKYPKERECVLACFYNNGSNIFSKYYFSIYNF